MNNLTSIEKFNIMIKAIAKVEEMKETSEYLQKLTNEEIYGIIIYEFYEMIKEELQKRANSKEEK